MKIGLWLFFGLWLIVAIGSCPEACEVYWKDVPIRPSFIVVGTLNDVTREAFMTLSPYPRRPDMPDSVRSRPDFLVVGDTGWIDVEIVLYGDSEVARIPITWVSGSLFPPNPNYSARMYTTAQETHSVGERRIWVLWRRDPKQMFPTYFEFQDLPIETLDQVKSEIKTIEN